MVACDFVKLFLKRLHLQPHNWPVFNLLIIDSDFFFLKYCVLT